MGMFRPSGGLTSACSSPHRRWLAGLVMLLGWLALVPAAQAAGPAASITLKLSPPLISADGSSQSIATATVTDSTGMPVTGEAVVISSSDSFQMVSGTTPHANGTYTATITSSTTPGPSTITATDVSTAGVGPATATLTQYGAPAGITILSISPPTIPANGLSTATVTAEVVDSVNDPVPGDTVVFRSTDPGESISGTVDNGNGTYSATITSSMTVGTASVVAADNSFQSPQAQLVQSPSSGASLTVLPSSTVSTNEPVTLIGAVSGSPQGTITFYDAFTPISSCQGLSVSPSSPFAVCNTSFAASASLRSLTAIFTPANGSANRVSPTQVVTVVPGSTATSIGVSTPAARVAKKVTYTASVAANQSPVTPTGTVRFANRGKPIRSCSSVPIQAIGGALTASCSVTYSTIGTRLVTATYSGDQNFSGSSSGVRQVPVQAQGVITSTFQWIFGYTPRYSRLVSLLLNGASLGTKVIFTCQGHVCPFAKLTSTLSGGVRCTPTGKHHCGPHSKGPLDLAGPFHRHRLMVGTRITVEIRRSGWIGKFYSFLIRAGQGPQVRISCLAPGVSKPGVGC